MQHRGHAQQGYGVGIAVAQGVAVGCGGAAGAAEPAVGLGHLECHLARRGLSAGRLSLLYILRYDAEASKYSPRSICASAVASFGPRHPDAMTASEAATMAVSAVREDSVHQLFNACSVKTFVS